MHILFSNLVDVWSNFNDYFDDLHNYHFSSLPYQIELLESMWLIIIFYNKEKMAIW
jgi:hypothetical protein